jgi:hypothetical protein
MRRAARAAVFFARLPRFIASTARTGGGYDSACA